MLRGAKVTGDGKGKGSDRAIRLIGVDSWKRTGLANLIMEENGSPERAP